MLSIGKIGNDPARQRYYDSQVAKGVDDYYNGVGEAPSEWTGSGARYLGIEGRVGEDQLLELFAGRNPITGEQAAARSASMRVAGFDLTFSAPKSVSVLFAHEEFRTDIVAAHEAAVDKALGYIEDRAVQVQRGKGGARRLKAQGLIGAKYRHRMSRAEDPHLHTHVVVANWALGPDGRYTALVHPPLYEHARAAGTLYQAFLRSELQQRLGWVRFQDMGNGTAELVEEQVSALARKALSKRKVAIEQRTLELARAGIVVRGRAGVDKQREITRAAKRPDALSNEDWYESLAPQFQALGLGNELVQRLEAVPLVERSGPVDEAALARELFGPSGLTEKANTFDEQRVIAAVAAAHDTNLTDVEELYEIVDLLLASPEVVRISDQASTRYTTRELLSHERAIVELDRQGRGKRVGMVDSRTVDMTIQALEAKLDGLTLDDEQRAVLHGLASSGDRVDVIEALAGTGKTTVARFLRYIYESYGYEVIGAGPTARSVRELNERAGIQSRTLDSWMTKLENDPETFQFRDISWTGVRRKPAVLVIDEAGMVHTRMLSQTMQAAAAEGMKIVLIGDSGQLQSVQAGGALGALTRDRQSETSVARESAPVFELKNVKRQRDVREAGLLKHVHRGNQHGIDQYLTYKAEKHELHIHHGADAGVSAERAAIARYLDAVNDPAIGVENVAILSRHNERRENLNQLVREELIDRRLLGEAVQVDRREFAVGERVLLKQNDKHLDVDNGMRGTVTDVHGYGYGLSVTLDSGASRELPVDYVADHVDYGYAITVHAAQGATFESVIVVGQPGDFSREWAYTALSRHRDRLDIHLVNELSASEMGRVDVAPNLSPEKSDPLSRMAYRMTQADGTWLAIEQIEHAERIAASIDRDYGRAVAREEQRLSQGLDAHSAFNFDPLQDLDYTLSLAEQLGQARDHLRDLVDRVADPARQQQLEVARKWQAVTQNIEMRETIAQQTGALSDTHRAARVCTAARPGSPAHGHPRRQGNSTGGPARKPEKRRTGRVRRIEMDHQRDRHDANRTRPTPHMDQSSRAPPRVPDRTRHQRPRPHRT